MSLLSKISSNFKAYGTNNCFCINDVFYTYTDFAQVVSNIRHLVKAHIDDYQLNVCLMTFDDIETYASIVALWLEGKSYVPITEASPIERNKLILDEVNSKVVLSSKNLDAYNDLKIKVLTTKNLENKTLKTNFETFSKERLAYILFTSGSTGIPKGVPITFKNLEALVENIDSDSNHDILPTDKCLQMFELTFDFSVVTYLMPLLAGACVFTIPKDQIKYLYVYKLLVKHKLTFLIMVPSVIHYLRPYFDEIDIASVRYCCFGAAPLHIDVFEQWRKCIPNAKCYNSYGPTEYTVTTSYYSFQKNEVHKTRNGIVSLGKPMKHVTAIVVNDDLNILQSNEEGELCLAGKQLTSGYVNNEEKNKTSFFEVSFEGKRRRFYKTGDLCTIDKDGYLNFIGRKDFQVKIGGYRIELSEIEHYSKEIIQDLNILALDIDAENNSKEIVLIIESNKFDTNTLIEFLKLKLSDYMIPSKIEFIDNFPLNTNGKIDRNKLRKILKK